MKKIMILGALAVSVALYSCKDDSDRVDVVDLPGTIELSYDFESNDEGWNGGIAEFPSDDLDLYALDVEHVSDDLPFTSDGALRVSATNLHDDFFMFISKKITGLEPNKRYDVSFTVDFAASVTVDTTGLVIDTDTTGIGVDTTGIVSVNLNDTIVIKAGATDLEPDTQIDANNFLRLIFDKGDVGFDGSDLVVLGKFASDTSVGGYVLRTVSTEEPLSVITNNDGELWLIVGTEATGRDVVVYYDEILVEIDE